MKKVYLIIFVLLTSPLFSHPHMLLFSKCDLEFNGSEIKGFWVEFEFDRFFGAEIIWGYDENRNGRFDKVELENLYNGAFMALKDYNYFTFIRVGQERFSPEQISSFSARIEGEEDLFYRFFVPLEDWEAQDFYIAIYDYSFFCAAEYQENYLSIIGESQPGLEYSLVTNEDFPVYYNPQGKASDQTLYKSWKPGLNTFIPQEIHIQLK